VHFTVLTLASVMLLALHVVHITDLINTVHFCRCHHESFLIEECDDTLLRQHELDHTLSFMLVELVVFIVAGGVGGG